MSMTGDSPGRISYGSGEGTPYEHFSIPAFLCQSLKDSTHLGSQTVGYMLSTILGRVTLLATLSIVPAAALGLHESTCTISQFQTNSEAAKLWKA